MAEEISFRDYVDTRFEALEKSITVALSSSEKAVLKAETATEKRFEGVNEFRQALSDQASNFLGREEYKTAHQALIDKIDGLTTRMAAMDGRSSGYGQSWGIILGVISAIGVIAFIAFNLGNK